MTERPIIFNGDMVRAILRGEKTQTRRPVKPQPATDCMYSINGAHNAALHLTDAGCQVRYIPPTGRSKDHLLLCPFGQPGDRLWVRETFREYYPKEGWPAPKALYKADGIARLEDTETGKAIPWRPSIHMPRNLSRITLEITDINVERVQDITEDDARAEGVNPEFRTVVARSDGGPDYHIPCSYRGGFANTWDAIYAKRPGLSWDENPWIWAITFSVETSHEN